MSGHSKWSTIKHKKAASDAKRGVLFTKLAREIQVAAREAGADPETNFRLRLAIQTARSSNMPNDNIDRAIIKGAGTGDDGDELQEIYYEGYGPGGTAILVQALTDNRNRTVSDLRSAFTKQGGNLAESGSVAWGFNNKGSIVADVNNTDPEDVALDAVDSGADDFEILGNTLQFTTTRDNLERLRFALEQRHGVEIRTAELAMVPKNMIALEEGRAKQTLRLLESLEDLDDVQNVYSNADFSDELLASFSDNT